MKIKIFENINESINLFNNMPWTEEKFHELNSMISKIKSVEESLHILLHDYLEINTDLIDEDVDYEFYIKYFSYIENNKYYKFQITYYDDENNEWDADLTHKQFKNLLEFLKDPELYKNSNKFNL